MTDPELIYSAGWIPADRVSDVITWAKNELEALWPTGGNAPDQRNVMYLLDSVKHELYKRAQATRAPGPPEPVGFQRPQKKAGDPLEEARQSLWGGLPGTRSAPSGSLAPGEAAAAVDSRAEYQGYRSGIRARE